jgi:hypothetical protein
MNDGGDDSLSIKIGKWVPAPADQGDKRHLPFLELAERRSRRSRFADWFERRQCLVSFERRQWFSITELADEHARKPGTFDVDQRVRAQFIDAVRRSIVSGEFSEGQRSKVLNLHLSGLAENRFDVLGASSSELFNPIASHLWIGRAWWAAWFDRGGMTMPSVGRGASNVTNVPSGHQPADIRPHREPAEEETCLPERATSKSEGEPEEWFDSLGSQPRERDVFRLALKKIKMFPNRRNRSYNNLAIELQKAARDGTFPPRVSVLILKKSFGTLAKAIRLVFDEDAGELPRKRLQDWPSTGSR